METPLDLSSLKLKLKKFIQKSKIELVFKELSDYLLPNTTRHNQYIQLNSRWSDFKNQSLGNLINNREYNIRKNLITRDLLLFVDSLEEKDVRLGTANIPIDLDELKGKLRAILETNGIKPVYDLLKKLTCSGELRKSVTQLEEEHNEKVWKLNNGQYKLLEEWEKEEGDLIYRISIIITSIKETDLIGQWKQKFNNLDSGFTVSNVTPLFALFSRADKINIPVEFELDKDDKEKKRRFKRLLFLYQDAYQAKNYKSAYDYCLKVREEIEPESAQLYEYLLLSFFKLHKETEIVRKVINNQNEEEGKWQDFRYLLVYASRLAALLKNKEINQKRSVFRTGEYNMRQIVSGLMLAVKSEYSKVEYDYIIDTSDYEKQEREKVKTCIKIATQITQYIQTNVIFAEIVVNELAGGGKYKWLEINDNGEPVSCIVNFDAYSVLRNAQKLITYYEQDKEKAESKSANNLLNSLNKKFKSIAKCKQINKRERLAECITAYRVGAIIFDNKKIFCDVPIAELAGEDSMLDWFDLHYGGELIKNEESQKIKNFDTVVTLKYFITIRDGKCIWDEVEKNLKETAYSKLNKLVQEVYDKTKPVERMLQKKDINTIHEIIWCIEKWSICYDLYKEKRFLKYGLDELMGNQKLLWFIIGEAGLETTPIVQSLNFNAIQRLEELIQKYGDVNHKNAYNIIGKNLFKKSIRKEYVRLSNYLKKFPRDVEKYRADIYRLIVNVSRLYRKNQELDLYKEMFFEELICEKIAAWLTFEDKVIIANEQSKGLKLEPDEELKKMIKSIEASAPFEHELLKWVINNRYRKNDLKEYDDDYDDIKINNYLRENRKDLFRLLNKFKSYYEITGDMNYLEIPHKEYELNEGKIPWRRSFLGVSFQSAQNTQIAGLSYKREVAYVRRHYQVNSNKEFNLTKPWLTKELKLKRH